MPVHAVRGATTCDENTKAEIAEKTQELVRELLERNGLAHDDLVSMIFTATEDLNAEFPRPRRASSASATSRCSAPARSPCRGPCRR